MVLSSFWVGERGERTGQRSRAEQTSGPATPATVGPSARTAVADLAPGGVVMLENLRFNAGETSKDDALRGASPTSWRPSPPLTSGGRYLNQPPARTGVAGAVVRAS